MWRGKRTSFRIRATEPPIDAPTSMEPKFTAADVCKLRKRLNGSVVLADDSDYHLARQGFVVNFQAFPQVIIYCEVFSDVSAALEFARHFGLSPVCRAGGHNTAGYSVNDELIIDVSRMSYVVVDTERKRATVGAGTRFSRLNAVLDTYGLHVPAGGCSDVAIAGYMQGGGYGFTSQIYGMNCDNVIEALVMLADGSIVNATEQRDTDLFWAIRGGTGNNFGVLLQVTYQLHDPGPLWGFGVSWPLGTNGENADLAAAALETLQNGFTGAATPRGLGHQSGLNFAGDKPGFYLRGIFAGTPEDGKRKIAPLLSLSGDFDIDKVGHYAELADELESTPALQIATHTRTVADSRFIERELSRDEWAGFVRFFVSSPNAGNFIHLESFGGAIRSVDPTATAFRHRLARFNIFTWVFWQTEAEQKASLAFLADFRRELAPLSNGHACQNYPNRDSHNYQWMYWGENYPRLVAIKQQYDPERLFRFGQTVSFPPGSEDHAPVPADARADIGKPMAMGKRNAPGP
jgi:FAD/FMN-containing dehydrogenase